MIVFTLAYLLPKLKAEGLRVAQVDGSVNSEERLRIRKRFELERTETEALDMLLFTEVGSEGLDYQFCDTIVNYDLPWNPMRIEQRIGRIDRRGQKSSVVHIYNIIPCQTENFSNAQRAGKSQIHGDIQCVKVAEAQSLGNGNRFPNGFSSQFHAPLFSEYRFSAKRHFQMDFERLNHGSQHIGTHAAEDQ